MIPIIGTFDSISEAMTYYMNSGITDWDLPETDFIEYLYYNANGVATAIELVDEYCRANGYVSPLD